LCRALMQKSTCVRHLLVFRVGRQVLTGWWCAGGYAVWVCVRGFAWLCVGWIILRIGTFSVVPQLDASGPRLVAAQVEVVGISEDVDGEVVWGERGDTRWAALVWLVWWEKGWCPPFVDDLGARCLC